MANNTTVNKVVINNNTVLDLTDTTATSDKVLDGEVFYTASGSRAVGTYVDKDTTDLTKMTNVLPINKGGTNATTAAGARTNLGLDTLLIKYKLANATGSISTANGYATLNFDFNIPSDGTVIGSFIKSITATNSANSLKVIAKLSDTSIRVVSEVAQSVTIVMACLYV